MWQIFLDEFQINDISNGFHIDEPIEGLAGLPGIRTSQGLNLGRDGGWTSKQLYDPRFISFNGHIYGSSAQETEAKRLAFSTVLHKRSFTLKVVTPGGAVYTTDVVLTDVNMPIQKSVNEVDWKINLKADDPLLYDSSSGDLIATVYRTTDGGFTIPFDFPLDISSGSSPVIVNNSGNETVLPLINIIGPATNPQIINHTTNSLVKVNVIVATGSTLVVDMKNKTIIVDGLNVFGLKTDASDFWGIAPGNNLIELITDVAGQAAKAEVRYKSGFAGI